VGYQLFVLISTGQQVANIPPVLSFAKEGDKVLWLESQFSQDRKWVDGAINLLDRKHLEQYSALIDGDIDNPNVMHTTLRIALDNEDVFSDACERIYIVLNGGKKLTPIGLVFAAQELSSKNNCELLFLYGDNQPVQLKIHHANIMEEQEIIPYSPEKMLNTEDIFSINNLEIEYSRRWAWDSNESYERYGVDADFTRRVHDCYNRGFDHESDAPTLTTDWPAYHHWTKRSEKSWKAAVRQSLELFDRKYPTHRTDIDLSELLASKVRKFYPAVHERQTSREEKIELKKEGWMNNAGGMKFGFRFEEAVWQRTVNFLCRNQEYQKLVKECLLGVKVKRQSVQESELDVLLTLTNGILIHLECKTWTFEKKDADARIQVLQKSASNLSAMYVVAPLFPSMNDADWFDDMYHRFENIKKNVGSGKIIAFTMPNPPHEFTLKHQQQPEKKLSPPNFEMALKNILDRYIAKNQ